MIEKKLANPSILQSNGNGRPTIRPKPQGYDWLGAIIRRKGILIFGACMGAIVGYLAYIQQPKIYASSLKLMIWTQAPPSIVNSEAGTQPQNYSTGKHLNLLSSEVVLKKAVEDGNFASLKTFSGNPFPLGTLRGLVSIKPVEGAADTLLLTAKGPVPSELPTILNDVVASYQDIISEDSAAISKSSVELIQKLQDRVTEEKSNSETRFFELIQKLGIAPDSTSGHFVNPHFVRLEELKNQRADRERELRTVNEKISSIRNREQLSPDKQQELIKVVAIEASKYLALGEKAESKAAQSADSERKELLSRIITRSDSLEARITDARMEFLQIRRTYGDSHPLVRSKGSDLEFMVSQMTALRDQRNRLQAEVDKESKEIVKSSKENTDPSPTAISSYDRELIQIYLASLDLESQRLKKSLSDFDSEITSVEEKANAIRSEIDELNVLSNEIKQKDNVIRGILDKLSGLTILASNHTSTKVRIIDSPGVGYQVEPKLLNFMAMSVFVGGLLGFGLIALLDFSDLSFRSPAEIQEKLGVPVIARIPMKPGSKAKGVAELALIESPQSAMAEAYRLCRTAMLFNSRQSNSKTFLITSPCAGDGKSTTSTNIALSFAQSGYKTVLVDADLRRPRCHVYLKEEASPGIRDYEEGKAKLSEIVRQTKVHANLSIVTVGKPLDDPSEFLESSQFEALVQHLKNEFTFVIFDSPPVLPVADATSLTSICDGVLVVLRIRKGVVLAAEKAIENLRSVSANILGVVVNSVDKSAHYSDYGKYGYSGYGGYGYYARRYYQEENNKYYRDVAKTKRK